MRIANHVARCRPYSAVSSGFEACFHDRSEKVVHHHLQRPILLFSSVRMLRCFDTGQSVKPSPSAWFDTYIWLEALYHVPLSFWAVPALLRDDPKVPLHLLVFALEAGLTTLTCITDYLSWSGYSNNEKIELGKLYVPYLALAVFMGLDMFQRLSQGISRSSKTIKGDKSQ